MGDLQRCLQRGSTLRPCLGRSSSLLRARSFTSRGPGSQKQHQTREGSGELGYSTGRCKRWFLTLHNTSCWSGIVRCSNTSDFPREGSQNYAKDGMRQLAASTDRRRSNGPARGRKQGRSAKRHRASPKNYRANSQVYQDLIFKWYLQAYPETLSRQEIAGRLRAHPKKVKQLIIKPLVRQGKLIKWGQRTAPFERYMPVIKAPEYYEVTGEEPPRMPQVSEEDISPASPAVMYNKGKRAPALRKPSTDSEGFQDMWDEGGELGETEIRKLKEISNVQGWDDLFDDPSDDEESESEGEEDESVLLERMRANRDREQRRARGEDVDSDEDESQDEQDASDDNLEETSDDSAEARAEAGDDKDSIITKGDSEDWRSNSTAQVDELVWDTSTGESSELLTSHLGNISLESSDDDLDLAGPSTSNTASSQWSGASSREIQSEPETITSRGSSSSSLSQRWQSAESQESSSSSSSSTNASNQKSTGTTWSDSTSVLSDGEVSRHPSGGSDSISSYSTHSERPGSSGSKSKSPEPKESSSDESTLRNRSSSMSEHQFSSTDSNKLSDDEDDGEFLEDDTDHRGRFPPTKNWGG